MTEKKKAKVLPQAAIPMELKAKLPKKKVSKDEIIDEITRTMAEMQANPGVYTPESIERWKQLGIKKPDWVTTADWNITKDLTPVQVVICHLSALAFTNDQICELTGCALSYVSLVCGSQNAKIAIAKTQDMIWGGDFKKTIQAIIPLAINTAVSVMLDPNTKAQTKSDAAFRFMDRIMGRPVQQIDVKDNLIRSVFEKLDSQNIISLKSLNAIELTAHIAPDKVPDKEPENDDPVDSWVKENL